jgi:hypothetical protein
MTRILLLEKPEAYHIKTYDYQYRPQDLGIKATAFPKQLHSFYFSNLATNVLNLFLTAK